MRAFGWRGEVVSTLSIFIATVSLTLSKFFYSWLVSFLHYISLDFHLQFFCIFFLCSDFSSNCLFWDDEDGVTVVDVSSLFSVDKPLLFVSFHGFVPKTATYGICLVAACMVMFFCKLLHPVHHTSCWAQPFSL